MPTFPISKDDLSSEQHCIAIAMAGNLRSQVECKKSRQKSALAKVALNGAWLILSSCASVSDVGRDYRGAIASASGDKPGAQTTILFLVDGLSASHLRSTFSADALPSLAAFFSAPEGNLRFERSSWYSLKKKKAVFPVARASFPTLTYPNLVSILTGLPVARHGILGNRLAIGSTGVTNFENVLSWKGLDARVGSQTVFSRLHGRGEASVSFSYPFPYASTAQQRTTLNAALDYATKDYLAIDASTLAAFTELLKTTPVQDWPRFIFVHLIALDSVIHQFGPTANEVLTALDRLDLELGQAFLAILDGESRGRTVATVLTSDHGFSATNEKVPIESIAKNFRGDVRVLSDNRVASIFVPSDWSAGLRAETAAGFLQVPKIAWTAAHTENQIDIYFRDGKKARIDLLPSPCQSGSQAARWSITDADGKRRETGFHCPEDFDSTTWPLDLTYIVAPLIEYFSAPSAPDILLIPEAGADFSGEYKGNHGALTPDEVFVPLLARHSRLGNGVFPTHRLLHRLNLLP